MEQLIVDENPRMQFPRMGLGFLLGFFWRIRNLPWPRIQFSKKKLACGVVTLVFSIILITALAIKTHKSIDIPNQGNTTMNATNDNNLIRKNDDCLNDGTTIILFSLPVGTKNSTNALTCSLLIQYVFDSRLIVQSSTFQSISCIGFKNFTQGGVNSFRIVSDITSLFNLEDRFFDYDFDLKDDLVLNNENAIASRRLGLALSFGLKKGRLGVTSWFNSKMLFDVKTYIGPTFMDYWKYPGIGCKSMNPVYVLLESRFMNWTQKYILNDSCTLFPGAGPFLIEGKNETTQDGGQYAMEKFYRNAKNNGDTDCYYNNFQSHAKCPLKQKASEGGKFYIYCQRFKIMWRKVVNPKVCFGGKSFDFYNKTFEQFLRSNIFINGGQNLRL